MSGRNLARVAARTFQKRLTYFVGASNTFQSVAVSRPNSGVSIYRSFSTNPVCYKKAAKSSKGSNKKLKAKDAEEEEVEEVVDFKQLLTDVEKKFKESLEVHKKKSAESKLGKANTQIFDKLTIPLSNNKTANFTEVAHTSLKGRNLTITVFDPKDTKHIVSAVIGTNLNFNPQVDPKNPQLLKVPLPAPTAEVKNETVKQLKQVFETFKSSSSKYSLSSVREAAMKELRGLPKTDDLKKTTAHIEQLHKQYVKELTNQFKEIEKSVLQ